MLNALNLFRLRRGTPKKRPRSGRTGFREFVIAQAIDLTPRIQRGRVAQVITREAARIRHAVT
jgi:hypothetical protein